METKSKVTTAVAVAGLCGGLLLGVGARPARAAGDDSRAAQGHDQGQGQGTSGPRTQHVKGTIQSIDGNTRTLLLHDDRGNNLKVQVAPSVKVFARLAPGDHVAVALHPAQALAVGEPGRKVSTAINQVSPTRAPGLAAKGGAQVSPRQTEQAVNVMSVDPSKREATVLGPGSQPVTVAFNDPKVGHRLAKVKKGEMVELVYTAPVATSITLISSANRR
jgi:hypothetical protein